MDWLVAPTRMIGVGKVITAPEVPDAGPYMVVPSGLLMSLSRRVVVVQDGVILVMVVVAEDPSVVRIMPVKSSLPLARVRWALLVASVKPVAWVAPVLCQLVKRPPRETVLVAPL